MMGVLYLGIAAWALVLVNFVVSFLMRRSSVRFVFVAMAVGAPCWLLREAHLLKAGPLLNALITLGVVAGCACAFILWARWLSDPGVLK